jgi:hypothetical protein
VTVIRSKRVYYHHMLLKVQSESGRILFPALFQTTRQDLQKPRHISEKTGLIALRSELTPYTTATVELRDNDSFFVSSQQCPLAIV